MSVALGKILIALLYLKVIDNFDLGLHHNHGENVESQNCHHDQSNDGPQLA